MPLLVNCPNGCQIRVPTSRAGRIVRCSQCRSAIRIAAFDRPFVDDGQTVEVPAKLAKRKSEPKTAEIASEPESLDPVESLLTETQPAAEELAQLDPEIRRVVETTSRMPPLLQSKPWRQVESLVEVAPNPDVSPLEIQVPANSPEEPAPIVQEDTMSVNAAGDQDSKPEANEDTVEVEHAEEQTPDASEQLQEISGLAALVGSENISVSDQLATRQAGPPVINLDFESQPAVELPQKSWDERLQEANADRKVLSRFLAGCLLILAVINIVPSIYHWNNWAQTTENVPLPRWIYLQIFVGGIYSVYAIFLLQIGDWSALRSVSVTLLISAFVFGIISTGLLVGSEIAGVLGVPYSLHQKAMYWCLTMLILATIMSYWAGNESANWRRAEMLLHEIGRQST